jgi:hypothetical protein
MDRRRAKRAEHEHRQRCKEHRPCLHPAPYIPKAAQNLRIRRCAAPRQSHAPYGRSVPGGQLGDTTPSKRDETWGKNDVPPRRRSRLFAGRKRPRPRSYGLLAMQKVVGSSPISRFERPSKSSLSRFWSAARATSSSVPEVSSDRGNCRVRSPEASRSTAFAGSSLDARTRCRLRRRKKVLGSSSSRVMPDRGPRRGRRPAG